MFKNSAKLNLKNFFSKHLWHLLIVILVVVLIWQNLKSDNTIYEYDTGYAPTKELMQSQDSVMRSEILPMAENSVLKMTDYNQNATTIAAISDKKIIKTANMTVQVKDGEESYNLLKNNLDQFSAFVENANVYETYYEGKPKEANITIRVPVENFEAFLTQLRTYGYVKSESVSGSDVTEQYTDFSAELTNLEMREEKVREFYENAKDVEDTLAIYKELAQIQAQIDNIKQNLKNLKNQTSYSTIYLIFTPEIKITEFTNPEWNIGIIWKEGVNDLISALHFVANAGIKIFIYGAIWIPAGLIIWVVWRRIRK